MKNLLIGMLLSASFFGAYQGHSQDTVRNKKGGGYLFTIIKDEDVTSVKNQYRSGTCWSFSTLSFIESELLRTGKGEHDLSEMFIVWHTYDEKAERYVRLHGNLNFSAGGAFHDVTKVIKKYGIVPEEVYSGMNIGEKQHIHAEMDEVLKAMVEAVVKNKNKKLTPVWRDAVQSVLDTYLGAIPETFKYKGQDYTPQSFAKSLDIDADDYVELTSYTHHPFYEKAALEIPDNWTWDQAYNLPVDEMMEVLDNALENGYTVSWASDVSEKGFSFKNGLAIVPQIDYEDMTEDEKKTMFDGPIEEQVITQEMRQIAYDNYETTDDHGMHITGIAKDQTGAKFYIVKNSWGTDHNDCGGYLYASEAFVRYKTMDIMVHKDAIPRKIRKKLGL